MKECEFVIERAFQYFLMMMILSEISNGLSFIAVYISFWKENLTRPEINPINQDFIGV